MRFGLCCKFHQQPIKFRDVTAKRLVSMPRREQRAILTVIIRDNAAALESAIRYCAGAGIMSFRINSRIWPLYTHPEAGYHLRELPDGDGLAAMYAAAGKLAAESGVRLTFHPDQFVLLNSPRPEVVEASIRELEYQAEAAALTGADVINIHGGGAYGDKASALERLLRQLLLLPDAVRERLTLENDDITYTPSDLLPVCRVAAVPLVYDVHHHRCNPDGLSVAQATAAAMSTWNREPLFHISSPLDSTVPGRRRAHHDFIDPEDFPVEWLTLPVTVEVEAKAKEAAIFRLRSALGIDRDSL